MYYITGNIETGKVKIDNGKGSSQLLSPKHSQKIINHSPDGFSWGYSGSGPAQLALAILLTCTTEDDARRLHQVFKSEVVATWPQKNFSRTFPVMRWLKQKGAPYVLSEDDFVAYIPNDDSVGRACGQQCTKAICETCNCSCGGENHGTEAVNKRKESSPFTNRTKAKLALA